jgi:hypothetical protein
MTIKKAAIPEDHTKDLSATEIADTLNARGFKTSIGRDWNHQSMQDFLKSAN